MKMTFNFLMRLLAPAFCALLVCAPQAWAQPLTHGNSDLGRRLKWKHVAHKLSDEAFLRSEEGAQIAGRVLAYQRVTGGWPKNIDFASPMTDEELRQAMADRGRTDDSTTDNGATNAEMNFLAAMHAATGRAEYKEAVRKGIEYLLSGQYENGGWPQFWPKMEGYQVHITYNDGAMANTMKLLKAVRDGQYPYCGYADGDLKRRIDQALHKAIECILNTQIVYHGEPTVWCQQHDRETFRPAPARAYELPSFCSSESVALVEILMELDNPSERVKRAVKGAMKWFDTYKVTGFALKRTFDERAGMNTELIADANAKQPLWARYYDLENCEPYVCDRDGIPRRRLEDIGFERRNGYSWYNDKPLELYPIYENWADKHDPDNKLKLNPKGKGANETGLIEMFRRPKCDPSLFDAIVAPGQSIQEVIDKAPNQNDADRKGAEAYKILVRKGTYNQKVIIDRPNIVLVGECRDSTIIVYAETQETQTVKEYNGKPVHTGTIVLQEGADDCVISGLTVYNNYGTTVEATTRHQFAIFGSATRTIVINCNVWADGNDALALWAKRDGMYYHADLFLRCPGVDFLCPRGWCYATRCRFHGDSRAILWHDGRGDKSQKLVVTNSTFDAASPTPLGRFHHDAQFFLANCRLSANIKDANIAYAYTDKVLDPCPWGGRTYYWGCRRDGGDSGWLNNNLDTSDEKPEYHTLTAKWTFGGRWNPESRIRSLWKLVAY